MRKVPSTGTVATTVGNPRVITRKSLHDHALSCGDVDSEARGAKGAGCVAVGTLAALSGPAPPALPPPRAPPPPAPARPPPPPPPPHAPPRRPAPACLPARPPPAAVPRLPACLPARRRAAAPRLPARRAARRATRHAACAPSKLPASRISGYWRVPLVPAGAADPSRARNDGAFLPWGARRGLGGSGWSHRGGGVGASPGR